MFRKAPNEIKTYTPEPLNLKPLFSPPKPFKKINFDKASLDLLVNSTPQMRFVLIGWIIGEELEVRAAVSLNAYYHPNQLEKEKSENPNAWKKRIDVLEKYKKLGIKPIIEDTNNPGNLHRDLLNSIQGVEENKENKIERIVGTEEHLRKFTAIGFSLTRHDEGFSWINRSGQNKAVFQSTIDPIAYLCNLFDKNLSLSKQEHLTRQMCNHILRSIPGDVFCPMIELMSDQILKEIPGTTLYSDDDDCYVLETEVDWESLMELNDPQIQKKQIQEQVMRNLYYAIHILEFSKEPKRKKEILDGLEKGFAAILHLDLNLEYIPEEFRSNEEEIHLPLEFAALKENKEVIKILLDNDVHPRIGLWKKAYDELKPDIKKLFEDHELLRNNFLELFSPKKSVRKPTIKEFLRTKSVEDVVKVFEILEAQKEPKITKEKFLSLVAKLGTLDQRKWAADKLNPAPTVKLDANVA
jgi:hypothetical protein